MCEPMGMQGCAWACPAAARVPESRGNSTRLQRKGGQRWVQLAVTLRKIVRQSVTTVKYKSLSAEQAVLKIKCTHSFGISHAGIINPIFRLSKNQVKAYWKVLIRVADPDQAFF
jgi:hypothetical protein